MEWKEEYNIGVEVVDNAHRQLFSIVRKISRLLDEEVGEKQQFACKEGIKFFKSYTVKHFAEEEGYMRTSNYAGYERHRTLHENLKNNTLPLLEMELEQSAYSPESMKHFLGICIGWLTMHIMNEDQAIAGKVATKGNMKERGEIYAVAEATRQIIQQTFNIDVDVLDEHYSGWKIGDALYYELLYPLAGMEPDEEAETEEELTEEEEDEAEKTGKNLRVVVIMEESFAFATIGEMAGMQFSKMDEIVLSAAKEIVQMLLLQVADILGLPEQCSPKKDRMLSAERFQEKYGDRQLDYSLLFTTKYGYIGFCSERV